MFTRSLGTEASPTVSFTTNAELRPSSPYRHRNSFAYWALVIFFFLYFYRPEDVIQVLYVIPVAKIAGILAFFGLVVAIGTQGTFKIPKAIKFLLALLVQMCLTVPFAVWRGGAVDMITNRISKTVIAAILVSMVVSTLAELRRFLWIQTSAVAVVSVASVLLNHRRDGRLEGVQMGILQNPNDLALNIAIVFPVCIAFMLHARGFRKAIWIIAMMFMLVAVVLTYSRGGLLALLICLSLSLWEYGLKGKRYYMIGVTVAVLLVGLGIVIFNPSYRLRVESIALGDIEGSHDKGSREARQMLLKESIVQTFKHPLFGLGPGNFAVVNGSWMVAHNTYTELSAEGGILALVFFLLALRSAFKNVAMARKSERYQTDADYRLFTQALFAGLLAYMTGACFASTEYNLYPFVMIGYTCVLVGLSQPVPDERKAFSKLSFADASQLRRNGAVETDKAMMPRSLLKM
jgi:putative inorganic carbon (HCO3(-)) transporter